MRLSLLDVPDAPATRILAIAVVAPDGRFEAVLDGATPIVESIEWLGTVSRSVLSYPRRSETSWPVLGIDAHKRTHTVVVVDEADRKLGHTATAIRLA